MSIIRIKKKSLSSVKQPATSASDIRRVKSNNHNAQIKPPFTLPENHSPEQAEKVDRINADVAKQCSYVLITAQNHSCYG